MTTRSLRFKVALALVAITLTISAVRTYYAVSHNAAANEAALVSRGQALNQALAKAAEEGMAEERLDLLARAYYVIRAEDVESSQVFSSIWEPVDAYPLEHLKYPPAPRALEHFKVSAEPLYVPGKETYDFYTPIMLSSSAEGARQLVIGYARTSVTTSKLRQEVRTTAVRGIVSSLVLTACMIVVLYMLLGRMVLTPVTALHEAMKRFSEDQSVPPPPARPSQDEVGELHAEFRVLCHSILEAEAELRASEHRLRSLFERVEHALFRLDAGGAIIESNTSFRRLFGTRARNLCEILVSERDGPDCLRLAQADSAVHLEEQALGADGVQRTVLLTLYRDLGPGGELAGYEGYLLDITEKRRLEDRLIRSQKLEAVGTLAGGIAHDFNNLLTAILGYSEILVDTLSQDEQSRKYASIIHRAAESGSELTAKILSVTRKEKVEAVAVNVNELVLGVVDILKRSIPKEIEVAVSLDKDLPMTKADPSQVSQVVMNLAVNARDAMPQGGRLMIETKVVRTQDMQGVAASGSLHGGFIKLSVSDTGKGIDRELQGKIFDPFFTTKDRGKGTGLGLYIVHSIVTNHNGYINIYSEPGKGTLFSVYLPVTEGRTAVSVAEDTSALGGTGLVLVIDDEPFVRELCSDMLGKLGYEVLLAESGEEGLRMYCEAQGRVALVILDMIMPRMGGQEVFRALREMDPKARVIICSGYSQNGFAGIEELMSSGAAGFIQKPFSRVSMAMTMKRALKAEV